jgi:hypothetical protein
MRSSIGCQYPAIFATMIGRLRVRLSEMEAKLEEPIWAPLRVPGTANSAGELLVGFQLSSSAAPRPPMPVLKPPCRLFDIHVAVIGGRQLEDTSALLMSGIDQSLVKYELNELESQTNIIDGVQIDLAEGDNPNYLMPDGMSCHNRLWERVELPIQSLYAPSLTFSVHTEGALHSSCAFPRAVGSFCDTTRTPLALPPLLLSLEPFLAPFTHRPEHVLLWCLRHYSGKE